MRISTWCIDRCVSATASNSDNRNIPNSMWIVLTRVCKVGEGREGEGEHRGMEHPWQICGECGRVEWWLDDKWTISWRDEKWRPNKGTRTRDVFYFIWSLTLKLKPAFFSCFQFVYLFVCWFYCEFVCLCVCVVVCLFAWLFVCCFSVSVVRCRYLI